MTMLVVLFIVTAEKKKKRKPMQAAKHSLHQLRKRRHQT